MFDGHKPTKALYVPYYILPTAVRPFFPSEPEIPRNRKKAQSPSGRNEASKKKKKRNGQHYVWESGLFSLTEMITVAAKPPKVQNIAHEQSNGRSS